ncbi:helix-turn-helix domain-containing protein [Sneathia sanguinegens]|uniref:helix-turn-helix domain-containing protein n=1 Tax=Sneathia sanguinegens TaxID=40543 RepID=UPI000831BE8E|nr:helix-turn-helix transcriptional regulator [Sneathia sanguinegens]MDU4652656.1 helix-turn-helix transcriptional regulator [Sneathia sanguinegens]MDU7497359.1 helix-turn-helix transcriptional regulator [Sneathia sanguinegens]
MQTTGNILKKYIKKKIKRDDLAKLLGISPQYLSNIMNDKRKASKNLLNKLIISLGIEGEDREQLKAYEKERLKAKNYELIKKILTKEGLKSDGSEKIYSRGGNLFNTLTNLSLFVNIDFDIFDFVKGDILAFKKYTNENLNNSYCLIADKLYKVKQVNDSYILESDEIKIVKEISIEYILEYIIRRVKK